MLEKNKPSIIFPFPQGKSAADLTRKVKAVEPGTWGIWELFN